MSTLPATQSIIERKGSRVVVSVATSAGEFSFSLHNVAASAMATDLTQVAEAIRAAAYEPGPDRVTSIYAPRAEIVDRGDIEGSDEVYLALKTENTVIHWYRFTKSQIVQFARDVALNLVGYDVGRQSLN